MNDSSPVQALRSPKVKHLINAGMTALVIQAHKTLCNFADNQGRGALRLTFAPRCYLRRRRKSAGLATSGQEPEAGGKR